MSKKVHAEKKSTNLQWLNVSLDELGVLYCGQSPASKDVNAEGHGEVYVTGPEQWDGQKIISEKWTTDPKRIAPDGSIFITVKGSVGEMFRGERCAIVRDIYAFKPSKELNYDFVFWAIQEGIQKVIAHAKGDIPGISKNHILDHRILLPGKKTQNRTVEKLDQLFSELDKGIESLKVAREQLKSYRQAVLKYAFEGKLTEQWRGENRDKLEAADQLLDRIKLEREASYEQQLDEWKAAVKAWESKGNPGKKPSKPRKPSQVSTEDIPLAELPKEWGWEYVGNLNVDVFDGPFGSNLKTSDYVDAGVRVIRLENIGYLEFIEDKHSYVTEEKYESIKKHTVRSGDIIFSSFITDGIRVVILPETIERALNKADCFCVRLIGETVRNDYLASFLSTMQAYKQIESEIHGIGRPRINTTQLKSFCVPVCSREEQDEIMSLIQDKLSLADHIEIAIEQELLRCEALRQSILKRAFSGKLVEQDPDDKPVSLLLESIKEEKAIQKNSDKKRTKKEEEAA